MQFERQISTIGFGSLLRQFSHNCQLTKKKRQKQTKLCGLMRFTTSQGGLRNLDAVIMLQTWKPNVIGTPLPGGNFVLLQRRLAVSQKLNQIHLRKFAWGSTVAITSGNRIRIQQEIFQQKTYLLISSTHLN